MVSVGMVSCEASAEKPQRFILTMAADAMGDDLGPLISEFGSPAEAATKAWSAMNMILISMPASWHADEKDFCRRMMQSPGVKHCMADFVFTEPQHPRNPSMLRTELDSRHECKPWYLGAGECPGPPSPASVQAGEAWTYSTGSGEVVAAVLDNGFDFDFPNIADNIWRNTTEIQGLDGADDDGNGYADDQYGWDAVEGDGMPSNACLPGESSFPNLHGTYAAQFVASINQGRHVSGVAWRTKLMAVRVSSCNRRSSQFSYLADGINYIMMTRQEGVNVRVISFSSSFVRHPDPAIQRESERWFDRVLADLSLQNIVFVMPSGNDPARLSSPSVVFNSRENLIVVGGVNRDGGLSHSWHPEHVDLAAPSRSLPIYRGLLENRPTFLSGTSYSAPQAAGALALLYAYRPRLSIAQARAALLAGVTTLTSLQGRNASNGTLNAAGMFRQLPGLTVDFPNGEQRITEGSSISFTLSLSRLSDQSSPSAVMVPVTVSVEDTSGIPDAAFVSATRLILTAAQPSRSLILHAGKDNGVDHRRRLLLHIRADDHPESPYAGASRNALLSVDNITTISFAGKSVWITQGTTRTVTLLARPVPTTDLVVQLRLRPSADKIIIPDTVTLLQGQEIVDFDISAAEDAVGDSESISADLQIIGLKNKAAGTDAHAMIGRIDALAVNAVNDSFANAVFFADRQSIREKLTLQEGSSQIITIVGNQLASSVALRVVVDRGSNTEQISIASSHADPPVAGTQLDITLPAGNAESEIIVAVPDNNAYEPERVYTILLEKR